MFMSLFRLFLGLKFLCLLWSKSEIAGDEVTLVSPIRHPNNITWHGDDDDDDDIL
jgi:hypothetical protein